MRRRQEEGIARLKHCQVKAQPSTVTKRRERWLQAIVLVPVGSNLTCEVPMPPLGDPVADTTHERATPRGEPRAWYKIRVDTLPGRMTRGWGHELALRKSPPAPDAL